MFLFPSPRLLHCSVRCGFLLHPSPYPPLSSHPSMSSVRLLKLVPNLFAAMILGVGAVRGLVQMRIKRLAQRVEALDAQLAEVVQQLPVDELEAATVGFILRFAMRGKRVLEAVDNRNQS